MTVQVALTFPDFAAAQAFFAGLGTTAPTPPADAAPAPAPVVAVDPEPTKGKPGRKPKAETAPEPTVAPLDVAKGDPLPPSLAPEPAPPKVWTLEEVRAELQKVSAKFGIDAVREIVVGTGGTARISDVPADKYAAVVEAAIAKVGA